MENEESQGGREPQAAHGLVEANAAETYDLEAREKARIRAEESYRRTVRGELGIASAEGSDKGFWSAFNEPFVLWLLSSVVLAGLTFAYSEYERWADARAGWKRTAAELRLELKYRLERHLHHLDAWESDGELRGDALATLLEMSPGGSGARRVQGLDAQFAGMTVLALLHRLRGASAQFDAEQASALEKQIDDVNSLVAEVETLIDQDDDDPKLVAEKEARLAEKLKLVLVGVNR